MITDEEIDDAQSVIARAASYARTSGDSLVHHQTHEAAAKLAIVARLCIKLERDISGQATLIALLREEKAAVVAELRRCRNTCADALATTIRATAPKPIPLQVLQLGRSLVGLVLR